MIFLFEFLLLNRLQSKPHPFVLPIRKGNELPLFYPKKQIRPWFRYFFFPFGDTQTEDKILSQIFK